MTQTNSSTSNAAQPACQDKSSVLRALSAFNAHPISDVNLILTKGRSQSPLARADYANAAGSLESARRGPDFPQPLRRESIEHQERRGRPQSPLARADYANAAGSLESARRGPDFPEPLRRESIEHQVRRRLSPPASPRLETENIVVKGLKISDSMKAIGRQYAHAKQSRMPRGVSSPSLRAPQSSLQRSPSLMSLHAPQLRKAQTPSLKSLMSHAAQHHHSHQSRRSSPTKGNFPANGNMRRSSSEKPSLHRSDDAMMPSHSIEEEDDSLALASHDEILLGAITASFITTMESKMFEDDDVSTTASTDSSLKERARTYTAMNEVGFRLAAQRTSLKDMKNLVQKEHKRAERCVHTIPRSLTRFSSASSSLSAWSSSFPSSPDCSPQNRHAFNAWDN